MAASLKMPGTLMARGRGVHQCELLRQRLLGMLQGVDLQDFWKADPLQMATHEQLHAWVTALSLGDPAAPGSDAIAAADNRRWNGAWNGPGSSLEGLGLGWSAALVMGPRRPSLT